MMRRLSEAELSREPARAVSDAAASSQQHALRAALLVHVQRALASELSGELLLSLRTRLEHAIASGLRGDP